jgi:hypothetical protein
VGALEECASVARQAVELGFQAVEAARLWRRRCRRLLRRLERAHALLEDAIRELESSDGSDPHARAALELLREAERSLRLKGAPEP